MKYYEIYVSGKNGFSCYLKTTKDISNSELDETILNAAIANRLIDAGDARELIAGSGYIEERNEDEMINLFTGQMMECIVEF